MPPVADHPVHPRTRLEEGAKHGCHNRAPVKPYYLAKDGFTPDGRQKFKRIPHVMSTDCVTGRLTDDRMCDGCKWKTNKDSNNGISE